jgi:hypothetical protein
MLVLGCIVCFGLMLILFCVAGWCMHELEHNEAAGGGVFIGLFFGFVCGISGLLCHWSIIKELQKKRAVDIGYGEYSTKGVRTINKDIEIIISGNGGK